MAHFAQVTNGIVQTVIVVSNDDCAGGDFPKSEAAGQAFIASLGLEGEWKQTSYSASFRSRYAGIGDTYDADADVFVEPPWHTSDSHADVFVAPPTESETPDESV